MSKMLPALPKSFGRLSEVFTSALAAVSGKSNSLNLPKREKYIVILVDGLGSHNLESAKGHARFLSSHNTRKISCWFPSTTAASLVSLSLGLRPGQHPFIGYQVFDREAGRVVNLLSGIGNSDGEILLGSNKTADQLAGLANVAFTFIGPAAYKSSGFTTAFLPAAEYVAAASIEERFSKAIDRLSSPAQEIIYLYVPELDQIAHSKGWHHLSWAMQLELLDSQVQNMATRIGDKHGIVLTADHGVIDVDYSQHIYLDEFFDKGEFAAVAGDTRALYLYLGDGSEDSIKADSLKTRLEHVLGNRAVVATPKDLREAGYWSDFSDQAKIFEPHLIVIATAKVALYHRDFSKPQSLKMIGHHGAASPEELLVPLIVLGA